MAVSIRLLRLVALILHVGLVSGVGLRPQRGLEQGDSVDQEPTRRRIVVEGSIDPSETSSQAAGDIRSQQTRIIRAIKELVGEDGMTVVHQQVNLANAIFLWMTETDDDEELDRSIKRLPDVVDVSLSLDLEEESLLLEQDRDIFREMEKNGVIKPVWNVAQEYLGAGKVHEDHCLTGEGVLVAVIDSGIDYTLEIFGGEGTAAAYKNAKNSNNPWHDDQVQTSQVVSGKNFVLRNGEKPNNPIDKELGHGTAVASAIVSMAPDAKLIACKVCGDGGSCPDYAVIAAIDYAIDKSADVINISLGQPFTNGYFNVLRRVVENAARLFGKTIVLPSGNYGNIPFVLGGIADAANAITVGATTAKRFGHMSGFSSRGPGILGGLKPDASAPGGQMKFPKAGSGTGLVTAQGTSFSSPLAAGAVSLIRQKCGSACSTLSIKSLLMNNARRTIIGKNGQSASVSWVGAGEIDVGKAVNASFWAYVMEEYQPSISLGSIDVAHDMVVRRTIRVTNLQDTSQALLARGEFRSPYDRQSGAVTVHFASAYKVLQPCPNSLMLDVEFRVHAAKVPTNHMTSGGVDGKSADNLSKNEFDGWIVISNDSGQEISIPFHVLLRRAAQISVGRQNLPNRFVYPKFLNLQLHNSGAGVAQLEMFELLEISSDDEEYPDTSRIPPADLRFVGYRTIKHQQQPLCGYVLEFAFVLWERCQTLSNIELQVHLSVDGKEYALKNRDPRRSENMNNCWVRDESKQGAEWQCAGFAPDHPTNSGTTILRACSIDLGIKQNSIVLASFSSAAFPRLASKSDTAEASQIPIPSAIDDDLASLNVLPGKSRPVLQLSQIGSINGQTHSKGLLLLSNGYRTEANTGASVNEAIAVPWNGTGLPPELTLDGMEFPKTLWRGGPECSKWSSSTGTCSGQQERKLWQLTEDLSRAVENGGVIQQRNLDSSCPERNIPRFELVTPQPTSFPTPKPTTRPTEVPSFSPTATPTATPTVTPTAFPTAAPTTAPTAVPTRTPTLASAAISNDSSSINSAINPLQQQSQHQQPTNQSSASQLNRMCTFPLLAVFIFLF